MAGHPTTRKAQIRADEMRGMVRVPDATVLPPGVAYLAQNVRAKNGTIKRRSGAVRLGGASAYATGAIVFDGNTAKYGSWPDHATYDLGTKWAILVRAKTTGTPGGTQFLLTRDVTPAHAAQKTFALSIDSSRQLGFQSNLSDASTANLSAASATAVAAATWFAVLIVRDGASLAMYLDGNPTAVATATISATLLQQSGAQAIYLGQNYDGTTRSGAYDGTIGVVTIFRDFVDVPTLLKYTTYQEYPAPTDPRVILHSPFTYSAESGTAIKDWSSIRNHGTLTGAPARAADSVQQTNRVQYVGTFADPVTGKIQNLVIVGGDLYVNTPRVGSS